MTAALVVMIAVAGCGLLSDPLGVVLGTSTWAVEKARPEGVRLRVRESCAECWREVLAMADAYGATVYREDRDAGFVVLTRVPGCIDTTQVGVWLVAAGQGRTELSVASPSEIGRERVAALLKSRLTPEGD